MFHHIRPALVMLALFTVLTGGLYPALVTGLAQWWLPAQADGSMLAGPDGRPAGSLLVGQQFTAPQWFRSRPSATAPFPYNAAASGGSNLGPSNPDLRDAVAARTRSLRAAHPDQPGPVPVDLVTASASGLDPHISVAAARYQVHRIAQAWGRSDADIAALVERHVEPPLLGVFGEPVVNVLALNLALAGRP